MPDLTHATRTLLRAISELPEGRPVHADTVREAFDAAELSSAERSGAFKSACAVGTVVWFVQSKAESRKSAYSMLYYRTGVEVPLHVCQVEAS